MSDASKLPPLFWPGDPDADHGAPILGNFVERDHPWPAQAMQMGDAGATPFVDVVLDIAYHENRRPTVAIRLGTCRGPATLSAARSAFAAWCALRGYVPAPSTLELLR